MFCLDLDFFFLKFFKLFSAFSNSQFKVRPLGLEKGLGLGSVYLIKIQL